MLRSLHIKDFAIIDDLEVEFGPGLTVMTGETGAGKTIVVEALKLILGGRASNEAIRSGSERAAVTAVFAADAVPARLRQLLTSAGIETDDEIIIHRTVGGPGKGKIAINGVPVTVSLLKDFAECLVDVSSQHEHQTLLDPTEHAAIVDVFGGHEDLFARYREAHSRWLVASRELEDMKGNERAAKERQDFIRFQLQELESARLRIGEEAEIEAERNRLKHAAVLEEKTRAAESALYGGAGSAAELIGRAMQLVQQCVQFDPEMARWSDALGRAHAEVEEVSRDIANYTEKLESNPARLDELDERLHLIRSLVRKHGGSVESCLAKLGVLKREVDTVERYDEILAEKVAKLDAVAADRHNVAKALFDARKKSAKRLSCVVENELIVLGMRKTKFDVLVELRPPTEWDESGPASVEFLISPNVGEPSRPLARIASGGELSRTMLAIKSALSDRSRLALTTIFDEVDAGIGGAVAEVVGKKLKDVARSRQVICITHLAQVAVHGERHIRITKHVEKGRTVAILESLSADGRVKEIARMLGGTKITDTTVKHAEEMLKLADIRDPRPETRNPKLGSPHTPLSPQGRG